MTTTFSTTMSTTARSTPSANSGSISATQPLDEGLSPHSDSMRMSVTGSDRVDEVGGGDVAGLVEGDRDRPAGHARPGRHR